MSWKFDEKRTAVIHDAQGSEWRIEIKPDSFSTYIWIAKPVRHSGTVTMYSGSVVWENAAAAQDGARLTLTELGFTQPQEAQQ